MRNLSEPSMNDYEKGLMKLGLFTPGWCEGCTDITAEKHQELKEKFGVGHEKAAIDLRTDPAFAWRVLEALNAWYVDRADDRLAYLFPTDDLTRDLYAAVCELGRQP